MYCVGTKILGRGQILIDLFGCHLNGTACMITLSLQGTSMPINIPMMGRANTFDSAAAIEKLDSEFVPPHIIEQQKVHLPWPRACLRSTQLTNNDRPDGPTHNAHLCWRKVPHSELHATMLCMLCLQGQTWKGFATALECLLAM